MKTRVLSGVAAVGVGVLLLGSAAPALAGGKPPTAKSLKNLAATIKSGKGLTYAAVYKSVSAGQTTTVNIAQQPPKSAFSSGSGEGSIIDTGTKTYFCSGSGGSQTCLSAGGTNPLASLEDLFSPTAALAAFSTARSALGDKGLGIKTTTSNQTFAGQPSTCITISIKAGTTSKYCVTKKGLLAYAGTSGSYFQLTSLSTSPASSLFTLPSGATTVTLPGGGSIP